MELLLVNHPLDCPMCDKGGECPLQNQAMSTGRTDSRFHEHKREYPKPINISSQVLLDRERCVLCQRCTRFSEEIAGDKFIDLMDRSAAEQIDIYDAAEDAEPFNSYFSGNTVQICPVGALTGAQYRFRARPFDLVSTPERVRALLGRLRPAHRPPARQGAAPAGRRRPGGQRGVELRQGPVGLPVRHRASTGSPPRWCATRHRRAARGELERGAARSRPRGCARPGTARTASACSPAAGSPSRTRTPTRSSPGSPCTPTTSTSGPGRGSSARRPSSWPRSVAGVTDVTYADVDAAPAVVLVGLEPEEECPILFLRLRKAYTKKQLAVLRASRRSPRRAWRSSAPSVRPAVPGDEATVLAEQPTVRRGARPAGRDPVRRRAAGHRPRWTVGRGGAGRPRPAPSWPGCRGARVTAARSTPAACPTCCPAAGRSPTRRRGPSWATPGTCRPARSRLGRAGTPTPSSRRPPPASSARWWWPGSTRPTWPTRALAEQALDAVPFLV